MKARANDDEASLVSMYRDLTGASESSARSVFMHVCGRDHEHACGACQYAVEPVRFEEETWRSLAPIDENDGEWMRRGIAIPVPG
jgi:hypothetical protein